MSWAPKQNVVVPVDFSEASLAALRTASELAEDPTRLRAIHVLPVLSAAEPGVIWDAVDDASREQHTQDAFQQWVADSPLSQVSLTCRFGDPGHEIALFAEQVEADLIVMPSHGRTGLKRLLMGSVAERVLRLAHCPVLILK